jgi:hypothetical protein
VVHCPLGESCGDGDDDDGGGGDYDGRGGDYCGDCCCDGGDDGDDDCGWNGENCFDSVKTQRAAQYRLGWKDCSMKRWTKKKQQKQVYRE